MKSAVLSLVNTHFVKYFSHPLIPFKKWEFQWYTNNRSNSFCEEGYLHMRPTLTSDVYGETFLSSGTLNIHGGSAADE